MAFVARQNLETADRLIANGNTAILLHSGNSGIQAMRGLLRYHALEQTRAATESWETAQIVLGGFFFFFLLFATREDKFSLLAALLMVLITVAQRSVLTPESISRGRTLDFIPAGALAADRVKLLLFEKAHIGCELAKTVLGLVLATRLFLGTRRRSAREVRQELDLIDKANYRHIDGGLRPSN